jgi:hypothetical protein
MALVVDLPQYPFFAGTLRMAAGMRAWFSLALSHALRAFETPGVLALPDPVGAN